MAEVAPSDTTTVEINDAMFCQHFKEVCTECDYDGREENDMFFGFDPTLRGALEAPPAIINKEGVWQCKKHGSTRTSIPPSSTLLHESIFECRMLSVCAECTQCYGWKKQITRARAAAKKGRFEFSTK
ncbi:hypothetical protein FIBSPDRAFT_1050767 [Athelia psychrophila]|uniref:Uncharacterized protein n=1 Tax=Athelia psychrophila TaxID=1759441 RepID=A0A166AB81_9AGAM|nr:hypothetical protein FIBSPDRAFT_1050767 [Fibularhizoctonia sp. CBS 109695]